MKIVRAFLLITVLSLGLPMLAEATVVDLATSADGVTPDTPSGYIGSVLFQWTDFHSTGTGLIDTFVQIDTIASTHATVESAYNTTENNTLGNGSSDQFNHELLVSSVPIVTIGGTDYRQFLLDVNEPNDVPANLVTLSDLQLFLSNTPNQGVETFTAGVPDLADSTRVFWFNTGDRVELDANLNPGSGAGDMYMYVPDSLFVDGWDYVYLYSAFGTPNGASGGFEEWAVRTTTDE